MEEILNSDHASQFGTKLSRNFGSVDGIQEIDNADYASQAIKKINDNFEFIEESGGGGGEVVSTDVVKFLHVSDPHGSATATTAAKNLLNNDADLSFLFVTGDMTTYGGTNGISSGLTTDFTAIGDKLLMLPGNHDTYDNRFGASARSQKATTDFLRSWLGNRVIWGDPTGVASYWHKDIWLSATSKLRIISMDQYEIDKVRVGAYHTMYTQAQVNWLLGLLKNLSASDYVIIATHEPPVQSRSVPSGQSTDTYPDDYAAGPNGIRPTTPYYANGELSEPLKLFVSEGLRAFGNRRTEPSLNLLPRIMYAYMHKQQLNMTYNNYNGNASNPDITINEDFSQVTPATFLFFIGGHRHCDICTYLPNESGATDGGDWSDQLMLYITCGDRSISYQYDDDLGGSGTAVTPAPSNSNTYRVNEVELDFSAKTITVTRYGACNTAGGRVRSSITFPFVKEGES